MKSSSGRKKDPVNVELDDVKKRIALSLHRYALSCSVTLAALFICGCADIGADGGFVDGEHGQQYESTAVHPVVGDWERTVILGYRYSTGVANTQVDRYTFHPDGTFDHYRRLDFLGITSGQSGLWREEQGRIVCEAQLEIDSRAYRDLLLLSADGTELVDLANRARGVPAYLRPACPPDGAENRMPVVESPIGNGNRP